MTDIARERSALAAQGLDIITRETWNAQQSYTSARTVEEPAQWYFLHISVTIDGGNTGLTEADDMRDIEAIGQQRFGIGFPYNAAAFDTGRLYEGQPLTRRGAHTVNDKDVPGFPSSLNYAGRALVLPQMVTDDVTAEQIDAAARWAAAQKRAGLARRDAPWYGHRDFAAKACPGDTGYEALPEIRRLTEHYTINGLTAATTPSPVEDDDMQLIIKPEGNGIPHLLIPGADIIPIDNQTLQSYRASKLPELTPSLAAFAEIWNSVKHASAQRDRLIELLEEANTQREPISAAFKPRA